RVVPRTAGRASATGDPRVVARRLRTARLRGDRRPVAGSSCRPRRLGLPALEHLQRERLARLLGGRARSHGLRVGLRQGVALWQRAGTRAALRGVAALARGTAREARLRARPLSAQPEDVATALGGLDPVSALRGPVLAAMPSVARFELAPGRDVLERADAILAHRFDLLGSGPTDLGRETDWR